MPEVERDGVSIHYEDTGSGPAVVLGHSFLCSGEMWVHQVPRLAERFRVLNVDLRGHGRSGPAAAPFTLYDLVDDLTAVLDRAGVERAVWAGLSIGGMVALRAALAVPERVSGLIVLDSHAGAESGYKALKYRALALGARALGMRPFLPAVLPLMFGATTLRTRPQLVAEYRRRFAAVHLPSMLSTLDALIHRDAVTHRLAAVEVPALVVAGAEDRSLPPRCSEEIAAALPRASLTVVPGAGHLAALEAPEAVTAALLGFLDGLERGER